MKLGVGLPATIPDVDSTLLLDWARKADAGPYSSLAVIDRLAYPNHETIVSLAAAAAVTSRIRLMPSVLLAPLRSVGMLVKEVTTLDRISNGRLTLAMGVGGREDDFVAAGVPFKRRGRLFEQQLAAMKRAWAGEPHGDGVAWIGPKPAQPGGPPILIGGFAPPALARVPKYADGFIVGGAPPQMAGPLVQQVKQIWTEAGREGKPYIAGGMYLTVGEETRARGGAYIRSYYAFAGPMAEGIATGMPATPAAIKGAIQAYEDIGYDELLLWLTVPELDQLDRLADLIA